MSVFHRSAEGLEQTMSAEGANRREVLMAAGGVAAASAIAGQLVDKKTNPTPRITVALTGTGFAPFEALAFSWGASNSGSVQVGGGAGAGKANVQDLSFTKYVDANSPRLFEAVLTGRHLTTMTLTWLGAKGTPTVKVKLDDLLVTSISEGGSTGETRLTENVTVNFRKIAFSFNDITETFDVVTQKAG